MELMSWPLVLQGILALLFFLVVGAIGQHLLKCHALAHIPRVPAASDGWLLGDIRTCGPMEPPFRTANFLSQLTGLGLPMVVYRFYFSEPRVMLLADAAVARVMARGDIWVKPNVTRAMLREVVGSTSVLLSEGPEHSRLRRILAPLFAHGHIKGFGSVFRAHGDNLARMWSSKAGEDVDVHSDVAFVTMGVIGSVVLRSARDGLFTSYKEFMEAHNLSHLALLLIVCAPAYSKYMPLPEIQNNCKLLAGIRAEVMALVQKRRHSRELGTLAEDEEHDFLDLFLAARDDMAEDATCSADKFKSGGSRSQWQTLHALSDDEITDNLLTFTAAGHATTSVALSWAFFLLATHGNFQQQVREECQRFFADGFEEDDDWLDRLDRLPLLECFVRESMRLFPPITITARVALRDDEVCGQTLPAGTIASIPIMALHRSRATWGADADSFRPARFLGADGTPRALPKSWTPFLHGGHSCIGGRLAQLEIKAVLARVLRAVRMRVAGGCEPAALGVVLVPRGLRLRFSAA